MTRHGRAVGPFQIMEKFWGKVPDTFAGNAMMAAKILAQGGDTPAKRAAKYYGTGQAPPGHPTTQDYVSQVLARIPDVRMASNTAAGSEMADIIPKWQAVTGSPETGAMDMPMQSAMPQPRQQQQGGLFGANPDTGISPIQMIGLMLMDPRTANTMLAITAMQQKMKGSRLKQAEEARKQALWQSLVGSGLGGGMLAGGGAPAGVEMAGGAPGPGVEMPIGASPGGRGVAMAPADTGVLPGVPGGGVGQGLLQYGYATQDPRMIQSGYDMMMDVEKMRRAALPKATTKQQNYEYLISIGVPAEEAREKVFGAQTQINIGSTPAGAKPIVSKETGEVIGYRPLPGSAGYVKIQDEAQRLSEGVTAVDDLIKLVEEHGSEGLPLWSNQTMRGKMANLYGSIVAAIAAKRGMGVLQPGEITNIERQYPNPSSPESLVTPNKRMIGAYKGLLKDLKTSLRGRMKQLEGGAGVTVSTTGLPPGWRVE